MPPLALTVVLVSIEVHHLMTLHPRLPYPQLDLGHGLHRTIGQLRYERRNLGVAISTGEPSSSPYGRLPHLRIGVERTRIDEPSPLRRGQITGESVLTRVTSQRREDRIDGPAHGSALARGYAYPEKYVQPQLAIGTLLSKRRTGSEPQPRVAPGAVEHGYFNSPTEHVRVSLRGAGCDH